ncbi:hypothetical protein [Actinomadura sp. 3N407]|uniref:hypothetical protein n=1 Tax=Actinomadura sp. 3N407 TaxID=3457423 RepID=UPI003FCE33C4
MTDRPPPPVPEQLLRHLAGHRDTARAEVDRLTAELADARQQLDRLETTHQTLLELTGTADEPPPPAGPPLPPAYQDILGVLADHPAGLRPKDIALALDLPATSKNIVEGVRAKLKRLVGRDLATEPEPGLFTTKPSNP